MKVLRASVPSPLRSLLQLARGTLAGARRSAPTVGRTGEPTFGALVSDRRRWLFDTLPRASAELHYDLFTKVSQRRLATRLGVPIAEVYLVNVPLDEALTFVERQRLDLFAIKPNSSRNSIGFLPMVREGERYRDVRKGRPRRVDQVRRDLRRALRHLGRADEWLLEELLLPSDGSIAPLEDYKFYCFGGRVELIVQMWKLRRPPWRRWSWYTRDWSPVIPTIDPPNPGAPHAPISGRRLVEFAENVSSQLCYPFIRIDLYDTSRGIVLGEFTPGPGRRYTFLPEWDERLSRRWREAAAELRTGIRSGRIQPLTPDEESLQPGETVAVHG